MGKRGLQNAGLSNSVSRVSHGSEQLHFSRLTRVWATPCLASHGGLNHFVSHISWCLSNSMSRVSCWSEQLRMLRLIWVWATPYLASHADSSNFVLCLRRRIWMPRLYNNAKPRLVRYPLFCFNWPPLLGQLFPNIMWELIPIMEAF